MLNAIKYENIYLYMLKVKKISGFKMTLISLILR